MKIYAYLKDVIKLPIHFGLLYMDSTMMTIAAETSGICVPIPMNTRPNICNIQLMIFIERESVTGPKR